MKKHINQTFLRLGALAFATTLVACGGGGGDEVFNDAGTTYTATPIASASATATAAPTATLIPGATATATAAPTATLIPSATATATAAPTATLIPSATATPIAEADAIAEAKALIANLRSNDGAVSGDALRSRIDATINSFESVASPESDDSLDLIRLILSGADLFQTNPSDYYSPYFIYNGCAAYSDITGTTISSDPSETASIRCDNYAKGKTSYFDTYYEYSTNEVLLTKTSNGFNAVIQPTTLRTSWSTGIEVTRTPAGAPQTLILQGAFTPETAGESFTISGNLPTRELGLDAIAVNLTANEQADGNGFTKFSLSGSLMGKLSGTTKSTINITEGYLRAKTATVGEAESPVSNAAGASAKLVLEGAVSGGAKATGILAIDNFETLPNGKSGPKTMSFNGLIQHPDGGTLFDGSIEITSTILPLNQGGAEAFNTTTTAIKGTLPVPSRPAMELTASLIRTSETASKITGDFKQGTDTVLFTIIADTMSPAADSFKVSTPSGVGFTLTQGMTELPITKDATTIGLFNKNTKRLVFTDGSYEQF